MNTKPDSTPAERCGAIIRELLDLCGMTVEQVVSLCAEHMLPIDESALRTLVAGERIPEDLVELLDALERVLSLTKRERQLSNHALGVAILHEQLGPARADSVIGSQGTPITRLVAGHDLERRQGTP